MGTRYLSSNTINVIIVDDNSLFRDVVKRHLYNVLQCNIIGEYSNSETGLLKKFFPQADVIFMDLQMPQMTGIISALKILNERPKAKIIGVTSYKYDGYSHLLREIGIKACVHKHNFLDEIVPALECVHSGGLYFKDCYNINFNNSILYN